MPARTQAWVFLLVLVVLALATGFGAVAPAFAHTELVHWEFTGGTPDRPQDLLLRFSEPIDAQFLTVRVFDPKAGSESATVVSIDPQRKNDGLVDISHLAPGTYSVAWWTRALDGDPSNGSFLIGVGTSVDPVALLPPVGARDPATQPAMFYGETIWDTILHWLTYLGAALTIGSLGFALLVWRPARRKAEQQGYSGGSTRETDIHLLRMLRNVAIAGTLLFLFANLMLFVLQVEFIRYSLLQPVTSVSPTPLAPSALSHEPPYKTVGDIFSGYNGRVWIARMALTLIALVLLFRLSGSAKRPTWRWASALVVALAMLATVSLTAHAAVVPQSPYAVVLDWSHMTAMSLWLGGLLPLILFLRVERRQPQEETGDGPVENGLSRSVVRRFSTMALILVIYLAGTGLFAAYLHVRDPSLLIPTTYGRALVAKLILFAALFAFGALHRRVSIPRFERGARVRRSALERILPAELAVGSGLLLAVALMASLGTSAAVWPAHEALGLTAKASAGELTVTLRAVPGRAGENALALDLADRRAGQATAIQQVTVQIDGDILTLAPAGDQVVGAIQRFMSADLVNLAEGEKTVVYEVSRPSYPDISAEMVVDVPAALASSASEK